MLSLKDHAGDYFFPGLSGSGSGGSATFILPDQGMSVDGRDTGEAEKRAAAAAVERMNVSMGRTLLADVRLSHACQAIMQEGVSSLQQLCEGLPLLCQLRRIAGRFPASALYLACLHFFGRPFSFAEYALLDCGTVRRLVGRANVGGFVDLFAPPRSPITLS